MLAARTMRWMMIGGLIVGVSACGGSASETPFPLEPLPRTTFADEDEEPEAPPEEEELPPSIVEEPLPEEPRRPQQWAP